ncbi:MAG TPA: hypothetical protein VGP37_01085, partial [Candidatus Nanopelagicales bacterium]|nr:hypothetical protein [Candidatus Nanopelagicales bacterium]
MNGNSTRRVRIEAEGEGVVAHVGLHTLGAFADRLDPAIAEAAQLIHIPAFDDDFVAAARSIE